jgi:polysaccharide export outer membrane protein
MSLRLRLSLLSLFAAALAVAQDAAPANSARSGGSTPAPAASAGTPILTATDPSYRLIAGDTIYITISTQSNQSEVNAAQTIGHAGDVRLPWIKDEVLLGGKTVREAERFLETLYKDRKLLKSPVASLKVSAYFPREVSVLGAVRSPGSIPFPPDTTSLDIVAVITKAGGFSPVAKADSVTVTHRTDDGQEKTQTLDLENVISGRRKAGRDRAEFLVYPGDRIWVPERLF